MIPFTRLSTRALPMLEDRIDTDILYPARFLLLMDREGLGDLFCRDRRFDPAGAPIPGNVFDDPAYIGAKIVLAGEDFGCGSSRIGCVIAPSFGEIFAANCLRNGVLAILLPHPVIDRIAGVGGAVSIDLEKQVIEAGGEEIAFDIPAANRIRLLNGWDDIDLILEQEGANVAAFEDRQQSQQPWLYEEPA
jgi:3-isopropylmalate/(R)-2-methylmalate dehydratase small subunit